jgi:endonuclease/exonuclease/phosphatase family metal-dependent hydrolase
MKKLFLLYFLFALLTVSVDAQQFTILSYNIYHGENPARPGTGTLDQLADLIVIRQPEVVALQEVDSMTLRSAAIYGKKVDLILALSRKTGYRGYFAKAMEYDSGAYGTGVLVKKAKSYHTQHLVNPAGGESRAVAWAQIELKTLEELFFGSVHLDHEFEENRLAQVDSLFSYADSLPRPAFLVGDFNFDPNSKEYAAIPAHWEDAGAVAGNNTATYSGVDGKRIDYVFYDSNYLELVSYEVLKLDLSDHYAVLVTLNLHKKRKEE